MSHPVPGHDYSDKVKGESDKSYKKRKANALSKALDAKKSNVPKGYVGAMPKTTYPSYKGKHTK